MSAAAWIPPFLRWAARQGLMPRTVLNYRGRAHLLASFLKTQGLTHPAAADRSVIETFQTQLMTMKSHRGRPYAVTTRSFILSFVKKVYEYLLETESILVDPTHGLKLPRMPRRLPRAVLTAGEMRRLLAAPDTRTFWGLRDRAILELLYGVGLRFSELANLTLGDVQLDEKTLWVRQGKGQRDRVLPLGRWATYWMRRYLEASLSPRHRRGSERFFVTHHGRRLDNSVLNDALIVYARRAQIAKPITPHTLRHTFATLLLRGGADIRYIQKLLGHATLGSTQIYTHLDLADLKRTHARYHPRERGR